MLRSSRSWRGRTRVGRRRRRGIPPTIKKVLVESMYGALFALFTFPISLFIAELGVYVMIVWMQPLSVILDNFFMVLILIQALFLLIPVYNKQPIRLIVAIIVAYALWSALTGIASFHPITSLFGELPY